MNAVNCLRKLLKLVNIKPNYFLNISVKFFEPW